MDLNNNRFELQIQHLMSLQCHFYHHKSELRIGAQGRLRLTKPFETWHILLHDPRGSGVQNVIPLDVSIVILLYPTSDKGKPRFHVELSVSSTLSEKVFKWKDCK